MNGHGFDITVTGVAPGARSVCVTALDVGGHGDVSLGCVTTGVAAVAVGQVRALEAADGGMRLATTRIERVDGSTAHVRVLVDGWFRLSMRAGADGIDEHVKLPPGDHEVVVTATVDGPRTIPLVLTSALVRVAEAAQGAAGGSDTGEVGGRGRSGPFGDRRMTVAAALLGVVVALLAVLVVSLLRSHAEILRALHDLGVDLDPANPAEVARATRAARP